ncbi:MAG: DUF1287 domain-containing protein [Firmicutes bacterium]|nr:DUF1287 domain-containing protein [Bacillota bacterium]
MENNKLKIKTLLLFLFILLVSAGFYGVLNIGNNDQQGQLPYQNLRRQLTINLPCSRTALPSPVEKIPAEERTTADLILLGARQEAVNKVSYDAAYATISYPGGDVPPDRGACTDVIIRAFRHAGLDLQQLIHEDMERNFSLYPQRWGLESPDSNIDHRRVPNQAFFFTRHGMQLTLEVEGCLDEWQWGDVVCWRFANGRDHCGIISDRTRSDGLPLVIHNAGQAKEEDCLLRWEITGHFRYPAHPDNANTPATQTVQE